MAKQNNDSIILKLRKDIEEKKVALGKSNKFNPITNCNLEVGGTRYNLNILKSNEVVMLIGLLSNIDEGVKKYLPEEKLMISGFLVKDWIIDLVAKYHIINRKTEQDRLKVLEDKLYVLLSTDKKVSLEIEDIMNQI